MVPTMMPLGFWIDLEYMAGWKAALLFAALALPIIFLGMRSLAGLGSVRKWVAIGIRLLVILMLVLILGGARWVRKHKTVDVLVLRDISDSTDLYSGYPGKNLQESINDYLRDAASERRKINQDDRVGVISFARIPLIDSMPSTRLILDARAIREGGQQTDIASAIQLSLATFQRDAMRRLLLISDGNATAGDLDSAISAAVSQGVPIDVMPLKYAVTDEVMVERVSAPSWKRESDAFEVAVSLVSTNRAPVGGKLEVFEQGIPVEPPRRLTLEPATVDAQGKLEPRKHVERVKVAPLHSRGARIFTAKFTPDVVNPSGVTAGKIPSQPGDTRLENNTGSAFTFVQGKGQILYVDNTRDNAGQLLADTLSSQQINIKRVGIDQVPHNLVQMQAYDAVVLNNVNLGRGLNASEGLDLDQDKMLASYVHDFGGGLIMIGGPDSFGAGGWQGSKVEEVMPVDFDVPAERQVPKGALVLVIHSCEMPDGNFWGEQCALKAVDTLSAQDEVGVISYDWNGRNNGGVGGSSWNYALAPKSDGSRVKAAIKAMQPGDMPSFDDCMELAINGAGGFNPPCLKNSDAASKHIIIISDGDPAAPNPKLIAQCKQLKITVSTISVYPHGGFVPSTMQDIAKQTGGRYYGPIDKNPGQLPQIFIKEATVVRRTLIQERKTPPIPVTVQPTDSDIMKGIPTAPPIWGLVLTSKKNNPTVQMPMVAMAEPGKIDPLFAVWQAGLGKAAAFTSSASALWDPQWLTPDYQATYGKFFAQMVRAVERPPMSTDYTVVTEKMGDKAKVTIEAANKEGGFQNFVRFAGTVLDPKGESHEVKIVQTGPGTYTGEFPISEEGNYVAALHWNDGKEKSGDLITGVAVNESPEMRELRSNDGLLEQIARRTGGRVLPAFDPDTANLFSRENLKITSSPMPVWDILLPILLALILLDVAARRIAWDWNSTKRMAFAAAEKVRSFTLTRQVEAKPTLDALRRVREEVAETRFKTDQTPSAPAAPPPIDPKAKFQAKASVEGDISQVVGGATDKPIPSAPKQPKPKGAAPEQGAHTGSLLEAKRRAQQQIKKKEQGE